MKPAKYEKSRTKSSEVMLEIFNRWTEPCLCYLKVIHKMKHLLSAKHVINFMYAFILDPLTDDCLQTQRHPSYKGMNRICCFSIFSEAGIRNCFSLFSPIKPQTQWIHYQHCFHITYRNLVSTNKPLRRRQSKLLLLAATESVLLIRCCYRFLTSMNKWLRSQIQNTNKSGLKLKLTASFQSDLVDFFSSDWKSISSFKSLLKLCGSRRFINWFLSPGFISPLAYPPFTANLICFSSFELRYKSRRNCGCQNQRWYHFYHLSESFLAKPKSVRRMCPSLSSRMFSGFRSR